MTYSEKRIIWRLVYFKISSLVQSSICNLAIYREYVTLPFIHFRELPTTSGVNPVPQPRSTTHSTSSREEKNGYEVAPGFDQILEEKRYKGRDSLGYPTEDILESRYRGHISPRSHRSPSEYQHTDSGYPSTSPVSAQNFVFKWVSESYWYLRVCLCELETELRGLSRISIIISIALNIHTRFPKGKR